MNHLHNELMFWLKRKKCGDSVIFYKI